MRPLRAAPALLLPLLLGAAATAGLAAVALAVSCCSPSLVA